MPKGGANTRRGCAPATCKGPRFPQHPWQGESLAGRHIYVQAEQGFGDTLHFARYLPLLAARAGKVSYRGHQLLVTLLRESLPGIEVLGDRGVPSSPPDCECALLSLGWLFRTRLETIPATVPYLRPPADAVARWRSRLGGLPGRRIGIALGRQSRACQRPPPLHRIRGCLPTVGDARRSRSSACNSARDAD